MAEEKTNGLNGELNTTFVGDLDVEGQGKWDMSPGALPLPEQVKAPAAPKMSYDPGEERRMLRNIIITSCSFTLLFTAFQSMSNLQTSFNPEVRCCRSLQVVDRFSSCTSI